MSQKSVAAAVSQGLDGLLAATQPQVPTTITKRKKTSQRGSLPKRGRRDVQAVSDNIADLEEEECAEDMEVEVQGDSDELGQVNETSDGNNAFENIMEDAEPYFLGTLYVMACNLVAPEERFFRRPVNSDHVARLTNSFSESNNSGAGGDLICIVNTATLSGQAKATWANISRKELSVDIKKREAAKGLPCNFSVTALKDYPIFQTLNGNHRREMYSRLKNLQPLKAESLGFNVRLYRETLPVGTAWALASLQNENGTLIHENNYMDNIKATRTVSWQILTST